MKRGSRRATGAARAEHEAPTPEPESEARQALAALEVRTAELDAALRALSSLERALTAMGGWMPQETQAALWEARALLADRPQRQGPAGGSR